MIEVLEIPVFLIDVSYVSELYKGDALMESDANGFFYYTLSVEKDREIILYFINVKESIDKAAVLDRLVPKAPFCFVMLKGETFIINNFCESYKNEYSNPVVCLFPRKKNDFDLTYIKNNVLKNKNNLLIEFDSEDPGELNRILIESFRHLLKNQE